MLYIEVFSIFKQDETPATHKQTGNPMLFLEENAAYDYANSAGLIVRSLKMKVGGSDSANDYKVDIQKLLAAKPDGEDISILAMCQESAETAKSKGFSNQSFGDFISLCHTELSEAYEEWRRGKEIGETYFSGPEDAEVRKPEGVLSELSDVLIRLAHFLGERNLAKEFIQVTLAKMKYNTTRSYKHGGKRI